MVIAIRTVATAFTSSIFRPASHQGGFEHFMLKEIFEQPRTVENALRGRVDNEGATAKFGGLNMTAAELRSIDRIVIAASGTSWHAALVGEYLIEELAHLPVEVEFAHEFCYRNARWKTTPCCWHLAIRRDGGHARGAARGQAPRARALAIVNVVGSTIARESDGGIYMHAGPEIGVASTKAFVSTLTILSLLAVHLGRMRMLFGQPGAGDSAGAGGRAETDRRHAGAERAHVKKLARNIAKADDFFFLSRGYTFPIALEGASQAEGDFLHPRRGLFGGGDEARPDCVD